MTAISGCNFSWLVLSDQGMTGPRATGTAPKKKLICTGWLNCLRSRSEMSDLSDSSLDSQLLAAAAGRKRGRRTLSESESSEDDVSLEEESDLEEQPSR